MNYEEFESLSDLDDIVNLKEKAESFILSHEWCKGIINSLYKIGIPNKLGIFLIEINPANSDVDNFVWVVNGDLPSVYLDISLTNEVEVIKCYCDLMEDWSDAIINNKSIDDCYPVKVAPTLEHAEMIQSRIRFIREEVIPYFKDNLNGK